MRLSLDPATPRLLSEKEFRKQGVWIFRDNGRVSLTPYIFLQSLYKPFYLNPTLILYFIYLISNRVNFANELC